MDLFYILYNTINIIYLKGLFEIYLFEIANYNNI